MAMFQLPSFFKIRLVALVIGFFILFWLIGFVKWACADSLFVPTACSSVTKYIVNETQHTLSIECVFPIGTVLLNCSGYYYYSHFPQLNIVPDFTLVNSCRWSK